MKPEFNYDPSHFDFLIAFCGSVKWLINASVIKLPFGFRRAGIPCLS